MRAELISETAKLWEAEPDKAWGRPTVKARSEGALAVMEAGTFSWQADLPSPLGGSNQAPSPTALLLSALAGCAVVFIRDTLGPQLGVSIESVEATASCEADSRGLLGMEGAEPDLGNIGIDIRVVSPDGEDGVNRVMAAWKERCPIYLSLTKPMAVRVDVGIENA
ncbi:MAG TPA: OsmC family protein [Acidimicrobiia bacterium]|nr:OsmC family protein [Acidimicrobiia bacterium]